MNYTPKMIEDALTAVIIFWIEPKKGYESMKRYSLDTKANKEKGNREPGMNRLYRVFVKPEIGKFRLAMIVDNQSPNGECLKVWNHFGQEEDPRKYNRKRTYK